MKIVVLDGHTLNPGDLSWEPLAQLGELTCYQRTPKEKVIERIGDAKMILTNKTPITRESMEACPNLAYIGVLATGYNIVDLVAAEEKNIVVTNTPAYGTRAVAQFVFALLLEICHHVGEHSRSVYAGDWQDTEDFTYWKRPLIELVDKTMGLVGYGAIGQQVASLAQAFGMRVIAYDPEPISLADNPAEMVQNLYDIYAEADVISLHTPLFDSTRHMINKESIARMKDGVILINTARGPIIDEQALAEALNTGKVYAAGLDVVSREPIRPDNPLLQAKNCYITPHIAWAPKESRLRLLTIAIDNVAAFLNGKPQNVVTKTQEN